MRPLRRTRSTRVEISLVPTGVGHAFPTGDLFRRLEVAVEAVGPDNMVFGKAERFLTFEQAWLTPVWPIQFKISQRAAQRISCTSEIKHRLADAFRSRWLSALATDS